MIHVRTKHLRKNQFPKPVPNKEQLQPNRSIKSYSLGIPCIKHDTGFCSYSNRKPVPNKEQLSKPFKKIQLYYLTFSNFDSIKNPQRPDSGAGGFGESCKRKRDLLPYNRNMRSTFWRFHNKRVESWSKLTYI